MSDKDNIVLTMEKLRKAKEQQKKEEEGPSNEEILAMGLETFNKEIKDAKGFLSVIFDADDSPKIIWSGDLDMFKAIGTLELLKTEFINNAYAGAHTIEVDDFQDLDE